ncbi:MAG: hypothetical protein ABI150_07365 [Nitrobacter sp.]
MPAAAGFCTAKVVSEKRPSGSAFILSLRQNWMIWGIDGSDGGLRSSDLNLSYALSIG